VSSNLTSGTIQTYTAKRARMTRHPLVTHRSVAVTCLALGLLVAACTGTAEATQPPTCDGISADMGGCDEDQPVYAGTTCEDLAKEWGNKVDRRLTAIIDGPAVVDGKAKSAQHSDVLVLTSTRLAMYMDRLGLLERCDVPEFLPIAETQFSDKLREGAGSIIYDGDPVVSYDEWLAGVTRVIIVIDTDDAS
jgi:hypothetical protein